MSKNEVGLASDSIFCPEGSHINSHRAQTHLEIYTLQLQPTLKGKPARLETRQAHILAWSFSE